MHAHIKVVHSTALGKHEGETLVDIYIYIPVVYRIT